MELIELINKKDYVRGKKEKKRNLNVKEKERDK
jgi:hypothetical protein